MEKSQAKEQDMSAITALALLAEALIKLVELMDEEDGHETTTKRRVDTWT